MGLCMSCGGWSHTLMTQTFTQLPHATTRVVSVSDREYLLKFHFKKFAWLRENERHSPQPSQKPNVAAYVTRIAQCRQHRKNEFYLYVTCAFWFQTLRLYAPFYLLFHPPIEINSQRTSSIQMIGIFTATEMSSNSRDVKNHQNSTNWFNHYLFSLDAPWIVNGMLSDLKEEVAAEEIGPVKGCVVMERWTRHTHELKQLK